MHYVFIGSKVVISKEVAIFFAHIALYYNFSAYPFYPSVESFPNRTFSHLICLFLYYVFIGSKWSFRKEWPFFWRLISLIFRWIIDFCRLIFKILLRNKIFLLRIVLRFHRFKVVVSKETAIFFANRPLRDELSIW